MRQEHFIVRHEAEWLAFEQWLDARAARPRRARADRSWRGLADEDVPAAYRRVCQQLGLARRRGYSPQLVARLQELMQRGHAVMYRPPLPRWQRMFEFFLADMPRLVRAEAGVMWASLALFAIPLVAFATGCIRGAEGVFASDDVGMRRANLPKWVPQGGEGDTPERSGSWFKLPRTPSRFDS